MLMESELSESLDDTGDLEAFKNQIVALEGIRNKESKKKDIIALFLLNPFMKVTEIARQVGVSHSAVSQVLNDPNLKELFIRVVRIKKAKLLPKALEVYEKALESENEKIRLQAASDILHDSGILSEIESRKQAVPNIKVIFPGISPIVEIEKNGVDSSVQAPQEAAVGSQEPL